MGTPRIKAVIWDMGGVILRTQDRGPRAALAQKYGLSYDEIDALVFGSDSAERAFTGEMDIASHWVAIRERFCLDEAGLTQFQDAFWAGDSIDRTLLDFICSLRHEHKTALLSNAWSDTRAKLESRDVLTCFDEVVISAEVGLAKPDPRIFRLTLQLLKVDASGAIFVDDYIENVNAARSLGMVGVLFQGPEQAISDVSHLLYGRE